ELARFINPTTVVAALETNPDDENYRALQANFDRLTQSVDQDGRTLEVIALPMPRAIYHDGQRLPASYCNFYIPNGVVIVAEVDDSADAAVVELLQKLMPERKVIGQRAVDLVWGLGAFHCITQQQPIARLV